MSHQLRTFFLICIVLSLLIVGPVAADSEPIAGVTGQTGQVACAVLDTMLGGSGISLQGQGFTVDEQSFIIDEQGFVVDEQGFIIDEQGFIIDEQGFVVDEQGFILDEQGFIIDEQGFTVDEQGFNLDEQGFVVDEQTFSWLSNVFDFTYVVPGTGEVRTAAVKMDYSNPVNVAAEIELHSAPDTWVKDLMNNIDAATTPNSLYNTHKVAVIFVDIGDHNDPNSHMGEVVGVFDRLAAEAPVSNILKQYIDISDPGINYRVSDDGNLLGIEGALRNVVGELPSDENSTGSGLLGGGYTNIVINMSLAFLPCADEITTASGYEFTFNIDDFIEEYNNSQDPNYTPIPPEGEPEVRPVAECVYQDGNRWYARFGYENNITEPISLAAGGNANRFSPSPQYRDQPSIFEPGRHRGVIEIRFSKPSVAWQLTGRDGVVYSAIAYVPGNEPSSLPWYNTARLCTDLADWENPAGSVINPNGSIAAPTQPIEPRLECIRYDANGQNPVAVFGYYNWNDGAPGRPARTVYVPSGGNDNKFSPNPGNRGQVTHFLPGSQPAIFEVPFKANEQNISWLLNSSWVDTSTAANYDFPTTVVAEAYPAQPSTCADSVDNANNLGNYLTTFLDVPEGEVLNVLIYLLSTETFEDTTDTEGLRGLLNQYLRGSQDQPGDYNIATVVSSGNYRPWFQIMLGGTGDIIEPLAPARWRETIAVSASLGSDAWANYDDDNLNGIARAAVDPDPGEDVTPNWMRWFFSHDGDIMARGAGYPRSQSSAIAGTSFSSPGAALVLTHFFTFPDACTFAPAVDNAGPILDGNGDPVYYPPVTRDYPTGWANRPLEENYTDTDGIAWDTPLWCVVQTNTAAVANAAEIETDEDIAYEGILTGSDAEENALTFSLVSGASHGTAVVNTDGSFTYTPTADYNGPDSFTFIVNDGYSDSASATVSITVNPVNDAPIANDDTYDMLEDQNDGLVIGASGVLGNDTDLDEDALHVGTYNQPDHGVVTLNPDGALYYTPTTDYNGSDSFSYEACDPGSLCDTATVTINITAVNDAPIANDAELTTPEDTPVAITLTGSDVDSAVLTFAVKDQPLHGSLSGTLPDLTYTPNENYNGPDSFTFNVNDGTVDSNIATVTINVTAVDDAPGIVIVIDPENPDEGGSVDVDIIVTDPDNNPNNADVTVKEGETVIYNGPNTTITYTPPTDFCGTVTLVITATVGELTSEPMTVEFTFTCVNDVPTAVNDGATTNEDTAVTVNVLANDSDPDIVYGDVLSVTSVSQGSNGAVVINPDKTVSYTPNLNFNGSDSFTYTISDSEGETASATVYVTVVAQNDPPNCITITAVASPDVFTNPFNHDMRLVTITVTASDPDTTPWLTNVHVSQDEPVNNSGDGNTEPFDAQVLTVSGMVIQVNIRAERDGSGDGRVYTIFFTVTDGQYSCDGQAYVKVGHDATDSGPYYPSE
jgi:VCBS repeat-containing protein